MIRLAFLLFICASLLSAAQSGKYTNVLLEDISFENPKEKSIFKNKYNIDIEDAFLGSLHFSQKADTAMITKRVALLNEFIASTLVPLNNPRKKEKSIAKIVEAVEKHYLKIYNPASEMADLLSVQEYNCTSQSLLYAYLFDRLDIPTKIEVYETCFAVLPYPDEASKVLAAIEVGPNDFRQASYYRQSYIEMLQSIKYVNSEEYLDLGVDKLYALYNDEPVYLRPHELLAAHYLTSYAMSTSYKEYDQAYNEIKKAAYLMPAHSTRLLVLVGAASLVNTQDYTTDKGINVLKEMSRYNPIFVSHPEYIGEIGRMYETLVPKNGDLTPFEERLNQFIQVPMADSTRQYILYMLYENKSAYFYQRGLLDSGYRYAHLSYQNGPQDLEAQTMYHDRFIAYSENSEMDKAAEEMARLFQAHPDLKNNPYFSRIQQNMILINATKSINNRQYDLALKALTAFEKIYFNKKDELKPFEENLISSYGKLAILYFAKGQRTEALETINIALKVMPNSNMLLETKKQINRN